MKKLIIFFSDGPGYGEPEREIEPGIAREIRRNEHLLWPSRPTKEVEL
jgi:hypothetical protein